MTENYLLDTNIITYLYQSSSPLHATVTKNLSELSYDTEIYVSVLSLYEIGHGIAVSADERMKEAFRSMIASVRRYFSILPLTEESADIFGELKAGYMKKTGITRNAAKRHDIDFMLAGSAISEDIILVSNDRIFEKIKDMVSDFHTENWTS